MSTDTKETKAESKKRKEPSSDQESQQNKKKKKKKTPQTKWRVELLRYGAEDLNSGLLAQDIEAEFGKDKLREMGRLYRPNSMHFFQTKDGHHAYVYMHIWNFSSQEDQEKALDLAEFLMESRDMGGFKHDHATEAAEVYLRTIPAKEEEQS